MEQLKAFMKRYWIFRNVLAVSLGIVGWFIGAYIAGTRLPEESFLQLALPVLGVAILVVPFVWVFVGPAPKK